MFIRSKLVNGQAYHQLVRGYRDEQGRVRHHTVASLGRHATPQEAIAAAQDDLRKLEARLRELEPPAEPSKTSARQAARLRAQVARLNLRIERLTACAARMPLPRRHQACVDTDTELLPTTDTGETVGLGGVGVLPDEPQAAQERITLLEQRCPEAGYNLFTLMVDILREDEETTRPLLEELKKSRAAAARLAWKALRAGQEEKVLKWLRMALEMQEGVERILAMHRGILGLGPHDEAAQELGISREELETLLQRDRLAAKAGYYVGVADGQARNKRGAPRMGAKTLPDYSGQASFSEL
jgi:hypothetical protein